MTSALLPQFEIHRATSVEQACRLLSDFGEDAKPYAGGVALLLSMKQGLIAPRHLIDIKHIPGLSEITEDATTVHIGAVVTHREIAHSAVVRRTCPVLAHAEATLGNERVRNVGTVGGGVCFGEPESDSATVLLLLDASLQIIGSRGERRMSVEKFIQGPFEVALAPDELVVGIDVPKAQRRTGGSYVRLGHLERPIATVGALVMLSDDQQSLVDVRIGVGCVGPRPVRAREAESVLRGLSLEKVVSRLPDAGRLAAIAAGPSDDHRASAAYRSAMISILVGRAMASARSEAIGAKA